MISDEGVMWLVGVLGIFGLILFSIVMAFVYFIIFYIKTTGQMFTSSERMEGKTVIVTGGNSGIGRETAIELAKRGARIILACRNMETARDTQDHIAKTTGNLNVTTKKLDLSSQKSIREFADDVNRTESELHVLIHNAGTAGWKRTITEDGLELTMATNYFGPFLLTHLLIGLLQRSAPSRIVNVASEAYRLVRLNPHHINPIDAFLPVLIYYKSKYATILYTQELARRLQGTNISANCLHPGLINTDVWRSVGAPLSWILPWMKKFFFITPEQGCQTSIYLAVSRHVEGVSGKYFVDCQERDVSKDAKNEVKARRLWKLSINLAGLKENDIKLL